MKCNPHPRTPLVLGVTGNIASGKSTIAAWFSEQGFPVLSADIIARDVVSPGSPTLNAVVERFGREILTQEGALDRPRLGTMVFSDELARNDLNAIIHPAIAERSRTEIARVKASGARLIIYEAPLLFEAGATDRVDRILVVCSPEDEQIRRIKTRDGLSTEDALRRMHSQMPQSEKAARADYLIMNDGTQADLLFKASSLLEQLKSEFDL